ncbi:CAP domain-containing protein [Planotetraspora sp. A-T 1434]|uniref:CAP domain-containing protein n=1 Tax=Planotetraspora sp. A-T 1434 TaxID=2979219 RepID=UPI0021C18B5B|nr:CAP domain-containing protein [Planotetraspora sp. A-T 1434]MCT9931388.1 CAP domain-containing protein [Planotetraspora sp. A-T 1434]
MNRALGAVLCLGSLAAIGAPTVPAQAESQVESQVKTQNAVCRVATAKPHVASDGKITAAGSRAGCTGEATFRVRIWKVQPGPDRVVKSGAKAVQNGRVTLNLRCAGGTFYTVATDYHGHMSKSKAIRLTCGTTATPTPTPSAGVGTALENEVVRLTNVERAKAGCGPLKHDAKLRAAAYGHSADMSAKNYFDHTSADGRTMKDRIEAAGYTSWKALGENIAKGYGTAASVVQGWMNSPGHRQNILNCDYTDIGVGYVKAGGPYWTQDFGKH